ncbi:hypothetical protein ACGFZQ_42125 [Streptomyces sp. NPDC048254]|uniref:hypothetical protein n=1 Tax=Streptomyces sp. NPDC048254 TaxID=3365525 RepID=UPI0037178FC8
MSDPPIAERVDSTVRTVPTDAPEADSTPAWDSTTLVPATVRCGEVTALGYTCAPPSTAKVIDDLLADVATGMPALHVPRANEATHRAVRDAGLPGVSAQAISAVDIALPSSTATWPAPASPPSRPTPPARRARTISSPRPTTRRPPITAHTAPSTTAPTPTPGRPHWPATRPSRSPRRRRWERPRSGSGTARVATREPVAARRTTETSDCRQRRPSQPWDTPPSPG